MVNLEWQKVGLRRRQVRWGFREDAPKECNGRKDGDEDDGGGKDEVWDLG